MNATDCIVCGLTSFAVGVAGALQDWPLLPSPLIGVGLGFVLTGVRRLPGESRERER